MSAITHVKPYFIGIVDDNGEPKRKFDFGAENNVGSFELEGQEKQIPARDIVLLPVHGKLTLPIPIAISMAKVCYSLSCFTNSRSLSW